MVHAGIEELAAALPGASTSTSPRVGRPAPPPLVEPSVFRSGEDKKAVETVCAELGLTLAAERTLAEMFLSNIQAFHRAEQLEAVHYAEGATDHRDLQRINAVADLKAKYQRAAIEAYRVLKALKTPQVAILANEATINLSGRRRP